MQQRSFNVNFLWPQFQAQQVSIYILIKSGVLDHFQAGKLLKVCDSEGKVCGVEDKIFTEKGNSMADMVHCTNLVYENTVFCSRD
jgi:hypothetical protein